MAAAPKDSPVIFMSALVGTAALGLLAFGLAWLLGTPLPAQFSWSLRDALIGLAATAPPAAMLYWFMKSRAPVIARFRESQIEFFAGIGFEFTPLRIVLMALFAGVFEELLFRGVLQTAATGIMPVAVAIILTNILFGLLHWRTALYALIAGILGVWLGVVFALTGNLLAPIIVHGLYDLLALIVTMRAIREWRARQP